MIALRQAYVRVLCVLIKCVSDNSYFIAFTPHYKMRKLCDYQVSLSRIS